MTDEQRLQAFVQSVYLTRYNRYIDDITDADGQEEIAKTIDWTNNFLGELELESDWQYLRANDSILGTVAAAAAQTIPLPSGVRKLVVHEDRPLKISQDGSTVSTWEVVDPNHLTEDTGHYGDRVTTVGDTIVFSRPFRDTEVGGTITADVIEDMPQLATNDIAVLDLVRPTQLLVLGTAKNAVLPDIVQGGLTPSFTEKYSDLLEKAVMQNEASASAGIIGGDDNSYIRGVY